VARACPGWVYIVFEIWGLGLAWDVVVLCKMLGEGSGRGRAHRQAECRAHVLWHLSVSSVHQSNRTEGLEDPEVLAADCDVVYEDCFHVTESLLLERSCSPLTSV
jgi:hypothetical protein